MTATIHDDFEEILVRPKPLEEILEEGGIISGGPSPWGHSFWGRALRCDYDGYLTKTEGFPGGTSQALVVGILVHVCLALYMAALRAGQPIPGALFQLRRPVEVVLGWCRKVLAAGESSWASNLYTWASEAGYLAGAYAAHWRVAEPMGPELRGRVPTIDDLLRLELTSPVMIEEVVETDALGFPYTVRYDLVYYVEVPGLGLRAVAVDHKTVGEATDEWVATYWQDPQLMGFFHAWNTTAKARGVPEMYAAVINKIGKPSGPRGVPTFGRYLFVLRQDRVALWARCTAAKAKNFHERLGFTHKISAPWELFPLNMTACFTKRYRPCERLDHCLMLGDTAVYAAPEEPAAPAAPPPLAPPPQVVLADLSHAERVAEVKRQSMALIASVSAPQLPPPPMALELAVSPLPEVHVVDVPESAPWHDIACVDAMLRMRGFLTVGKQDEECVKVTGRRLPELTSADVEAMVKHLLPKEPAPAAEPVQPSLPEDDDWLEIEESQDEIDLRSVMAELRERSAGDGKRLDYLSWLESAEDVDVRSHAASLGQGDRILRYRDPLKVRLEVARVLLEWALTVPAGAQEESGPPATPLDGPVPSASPAPPPPAAAPPPPPVGWPSVPRGFSPKEKYVVRKWYDLHLGTAADVPRGCWAYITGSLAWATGEVAHDNVQFLTEGGLPLGAKPDTRALPVDVETPEEAQARVEAKAAASAAEKAAKQVEREEKAAAKEAAAAEAAAAGPDPVVGPTQIGEQATLRGIVPVYYFGSHERLLKATKEQIFAQLREPGYAVAMIGKDPAARKLKVWLSVEGIAAACTKSTLGSAAWDQLGRLALSAATPVAAEAGDDAVGGSEEVAS